MLLYWTRSLLIRRRVTKWSVWRCVKLLHPPPFLYPCPCLLPCVSCQPWMLPDLLERHPLPLVCVETSGHQTLHCLRQVQLVIPDQWPKHDLLIRLVRDVPAQHVIEQDLSNICLSGPGQWTSPTLSWNCCQCQSWDNFPWHCPLDRQSTVCPV